MATIASALDYETKSSYSITVNASDGTNTASSMLAISVTNVLLDSLVTAVQNTPFLESNANGKAVASVSSIANSDNEALVYTLSGTGSNKFTVNASTGAITTASALDFEEARTYNLTLTATGQTTGTTASSAITVPVKNVEEMQSMTLRYSPVALSPSRTGFSATATRDGGPSGTNLGNFTQEQVVTAAAATADSKYLTSYHNGSNMTTPVSIDRNDGVKYDTTVDNFDFKYFYPIGATAGAGQYQFSPGQQALDGHYKTVGAQSQVTLDVTQSEVVSAGRLSSGKVCWMVTDKNAATMNFNSRQSNAPDVDVLFLHNNGASNTSMSDDWGWRSISNNCSCLGKLSLNSLYIHNISSCISS